MSVLTLNLCIICPKNLNLLFGGTVFGGTVFGATIFGATVFGATVFGILEIPLYFTSEIPLHFYLVVKPYLVVPQIFFVPPDFFCTLRFFSSLFGTPIFENHNWF